MNRITTHRRGALVAVLAVVCLVIPLAVYAQPGSQDAAGDPAPLGCRVEGDEVTFTFDSSLYQSGTRGDNGARVSMADVSLGDFSVVAVAGEFNDWSTGAWTMEPVGPGIYETRRPLGQFAKRASWAFKFVIDGMLWVEPPASAPNAVPTGFSNDSFNLRLVLPMHVDSPLLESLSLSASQLPGGCALKPVDEAMGKAPIAVDSNPMITSDSRTIGFVSVFVMPPSPEEEAAWEAETSTLGPGAVMKRIEELMAERTSTVRAAYIAVYESTESGREMGVFAMEFSEPLSPERREALAMEGPGGAVVAGDRVAAAVWTDDPGRICFDAVLAHVRSVLGE